MACVVVVYLKVLFKKYVILRLRTHCSKSSDKGMYLKAGFVDILNTTIIIKQMLLW
jgi:hypothetical protein